jgi:O-antigen/teichoic acid export membrane protein
MYGAAALGFLGTIVAARLLGPADFGLYAVVVSSVSFLQLLLDLTVEEAMVKYGFRYSAREEWGKLHRLVRAALAVKLAGGLLAALVLVALAPVADRIFNGDGLATAFLVAALLPAVQAPEGIAANALILRGRYDLRGAFLAVGMALRLVALVVGARYGVVEAVIGLVAAQVVSTAAIGVAGRLAVGRFPAAAPEPIGDDRREVRSFVVQSSIGTGLVSLRSWIAPLLLGVVSGPLQVGFFRVAQAPQAGFASLSSPVRLILLTEQTRDWERGRPDVVMRGLRRYTVGAALLMAVALPPFLVFMDDLVRLVFGAAYAPAADAARLILVAAALQLVYGWSKSFPVSIGRPNLRIVAHGVEAAVLLPLVVVFGSLWGATGAAAAVLVSTVAFVAVWTVLVLRIARGPLPFAREVAV